MAELRGRTCRMSRVLLAQLAAASCLLLLEDILSSAAATHLEYPENQCDVREESISCNHLNLVDLNNVSLQSDINYIRTFTAAFNRFNDIPHILHKAINLTRISLHHNNISSFDALTFNELKKLKVLDLSYNVLVELYLSEGSFPALVHLNVSNNYLQIVSVSLGIGKRLKYLNLRRNELGNNINFLRNLSVLEELNLGHNRISKIGRKLLGDRNRSMFHRFIIDGNALTDVSFLYDYDYLKYLDISNNNISSIAENLFVDLTILGHLNVSNNEINNSEFLVFALNNTALYNLDLSYNKIKYISPSFFSNKNNRTQHLNVSHNQLKDLSFVSNLKRLITFSADSNNIKHISNSVLSTELSELSLKNNNISEVKFLSDLSDLRKLYLSSNKINETKNIFQKMEKLEHLDLSNNDLLNVELDIYAPNFEYLNISHNKLLYLPCNKFLKSMDINENRVTDLNVRCLHRLHFLSVGGVEIKNKYQIPLSEASSLMLETSNQNTITCRHSTPGILKCEEMCHSNYTRETEIFCTVILDSSFPLTYIGVSLVLIMILLLLGLRRRFLSKMKFHTKCTCNHELNTLQPPS